MEGALDKLIAEVGRGVTQVEMLVGREALGSWPGATSKLTLWAHLPPAEGKLVHAYMTLGLEAATTASLPLRVKVLLDGASVTREVKPQFTVELDETKYHKAAYDVRPILAKRLGKGWFHRLQFIYDLVQPVYFRDATFILLYEVEGARYAISALTGAKVLEPGEVSVEYPPFYNSFGGARTASLIIHSPYHESKFEVVVAGASSGAIQGLGSFPIRVPFTYRGNLIPVSIKYMKHEYPFYPKRAVITDIVLEEVKLPESRVDIEIVSTELVQDRVKVKVIVKNEGDVTLKRAIVSLVALGGQLAQKKLRALEAGSVAEVELMADISRLPAKPSSAVVTLIGYVLGKRVEVSKEVRL
ncbi:MAG: hypothetical protein F7C35_02920 [Desulfurococcales archaeon]|nr:hypothetical protein [Desulfurococcales archaeon]